MILPAQHIRARKGMIEPFEERGVASGMSYGLSAAGYDVRIDQPRILRPGDFALASTRERFEMPNDILATVHDKSTWARRGLAVQTTVVEPGWFGHLTLELTNHGEHLIRIDAGTPIAQIIFHQLLEPTDQPYKGKYNGQKAVPVGPRFEDGNNELEEWREIPGVSGYEASNFGRIRSLDRFVVRIQSGVEISQFHRGRVLRPCECKNGYKYVNAARRHVQVHRLIAITFVEGYLAGLDVDHKNGDRHDNRATNLRWVTRSENLKNAVMRRGAWGSQKSQERGPVAARMEGE